MAGEVFPLFPVCSLSVPGSAFFNLPGNFYFTYGVSKEQVFFQEPLG